MVKTNALISTVIMALIPFCANAANQGQGVVNFKGSVINAACGIVSESADQSIDFGQISVSHLKADGISVKKSIQIELANCEPDKSVKVTFSGTTVSGAKTELGTSGNTGTAIVISAQNGSLIEFGAEGAAHQLKEGKNTLQFLSWVKKASGSNVTEGDFTAVANFNLSYS